ncbi:ABC transporter substrate-binding protein [Pelagovum pacificum]|nr:ABC transporter substrate-binding protein [Pelagovum pacificum]QQA44320.1 ABC transporter substrate-binding protein [Pelagovum pacificum]
MVSGLAISSAIGGPASAQTSDTLVIALSARGLRTIDSAKSIQGADEWAIIHIFETLVMGPEGRFPTTVDEVQPALATSWSMSDDATEWTFEIREGVQFHKDYGELTAEDVAFSLGRLIDPDILGVRAALFQNASSVTVEGPMTVKITLSQPDPLFIIGPMLHHSASVISKAAYEEKGPEAFETDPIGTGPYQLEEVAQDPSMGVLLTAFEGYWGDQPATPNLRVRYISDTTARTLALLSGDVHMIEGVRAPGWVPSIQQRAGDLHFDTASPGSFFTVSMNMTVPPFDDQRVRQAVAYLIDRDTIAEAMAPISQRTWGLNPPSFPGGFNGETIPEEVRYDYNVERAKELLTEAGYPDGLSFDAYTSQREDYSSISLMIQEMLRAGGIDMNLELKDHTAFHADQGTGTNTLFQRSSAYPPVPTLAITDQLSVENEVQSDGSGGPNFSHYGADGNGIDDLLAEAMAEPNLERRIEKVQEIEVKFLTDMPMLPVSTNAYLIVRAANVDLGYEQESGFAHWRLDKATIN